MSRFGTVQLQLNDFILHPGFSVSEDILPGIEFGSVSATDRDMLGSISYTLISDEFAINNLNRSLVKRNGVDLDFETR